MRITKGLLLKDEKKAPKEYRKYLKGVHGIARRNIIKSIIKDERRHYKLLKKL